MGLTTSVDYRDAANIAAKVSGLLSIIGSTFIVRDIFIKSRKQGNEKLPMTSLIVLNMSVADIGSSFWMHFLGTWMTPSEWVFALASGNQATCNAQAFLFDLFIYSANWSNCMLSVTCELEIVYASNKCIQL